MLEYELAVVGAGWAGFNAARKAKELGLRVCLIDKSHIGGTCLNSGCIPAKTLIQSAKVYNLIKKSAHFGIEVQTPQANFIKIQERKERVIQQLRQGMQGMLSGIDFLEGEAKFIAKDRIKAADKEIKVKAVIVATGSRPYELPDLRFDGKKILSSDDVLNLKEVPRSLLIIGGGVIGCEFASLFSTLGSKITIVEKMPFLLPGEDVEVSKKLESVFRKKGIKVNINTDAGALDLSGYDAILVSIGRVPVAGGLGLEELGVKLDKGRILTDEYLKSNVENIYAAGDCASSICLAHYAAYQGRLAVENIVYPDRQKKVSAVNIPGCIFTESEIGRIGITEEEARMGGREVQVDKIDFLSNGMARILDETEGFLKVISDKKTGRVLGAAIIGPKATELIGIFSVVLSGGLNITQLKNTIFAHPTLSESISQMLE